MYLKFLSVIGLFVFAAGHTASAQCFIVASQKHKDIMLREFGVVVEERQGNFSSKEECEAYLDRILAYDPRQRAEHWCDCESQPGATNQGMQNQNKLLVPDRETQLRRIKAYNLSKIEEKENADAKRFQGDKNDVSLKLKRNKSLDQLKTTTEISGQSAVNDQEKGRSESESSFSDGKIKLKGRQQTNTVPVSPPKPLDHQKNLFEYLDRQTKVVSSRITEVQKQKIQILEKKIQLGEKIAEQKLKVEKLESEKNEMQNENRTGEIDSLLLLAAQMLEESEDLNRNADRDLQEQNKLLEQNETLLNKYQDSYNKAKQSPEQSESLLNELERDMK